MNEATSALDRLLNVLSAQPEGRQPAGSDEAGPSAPPSALPRDAIDAVLAAEPRRTAVRSLRSDPVVLAFQSELESGMIRADTARRLLGLLSTILDGYLTR